MNRKICLIAGKFVSLLLVSMLISAGLILLWPKVQDMILFYQMTKIEEKGRTIYVAITETNKERESLGLHPLWPSDTSSSSDRGNLNFTNSTDYFKYLFDEENYGKPGWKPLVKGFDYSLLAGAGVEECKDGKLNPENNMWTIAKNINEIYHDCIPVLITRNFDPAYIPPYPPSGRWVDELTNLIPLGDTCNTPFGNKGAVMIRRDGDMLRFRQKYSTIAVIYNAGSSAHYTATYKYLTPTKEILAVGKKLSISIESCRKSRKRYGMMLWLMVSAIVFGVGSGTLVLHSKIRSHDD